MFWGGILLGERRFSAEFDWRYMTLSTLISPHRNPNGYVWASGALALSALSALFWAVALEWRHWRTAAGHLVVAVVCTVYAVMLPWRLPRLPKEHEVLTLFAFSGLCLCMIRLGYQTAQEALRRRTVASARRVRLYGAGFAGLAVLPIFLAGLAEAYVYYVLPQLHWVSLAWRTRVVPVYLSFAFWEWITCAVLSVLWLFSPSRRGREVKGAKPWDNPDAGKPSNLLLSRIRRQAGATAEGSRGNS